MRIVVPTKLIEGTHWPELPEGIGWSDAEYSSDYTTAAVTLPDTPEVEQWAVDQGYHTPARVTSGRFQIALKAKDSDVYAAVRQMIDADEDLALAAGEPYFNRGSSTIADLQAQLQSTGFSQVTDDWVDDLFRDAFLLEL